MLLKMNEKMNHCKLLCLLSHAASKFNAMKMQYVMFFSLYILFCLIPVYIDVIGKHKKAERQHYFTPVKNG